LGGGGGGIGGGMGPWAISNTAPGVGSGDDWLTGTARESRIKLTDNATARFRTRFFMGNPPGAKGAATPHESSFALKKVPFTEQGLESGTLHA